MCILKYKINAQSNPVEQTKSLYELREGGWNVPQRMENRFIHFLDYYPPMFVVGLGLARF